MRPSQYKTVLCIHYPNCKRGKRCSFAHGKKELRPKRDTLSKIQKQTPIYFGTSEELKYLVRDLVYYACKQTCVYCPNQAIIFTSRSVRELLPFSTPKKLCQPTSTMVTVEYLLGEKVIKAPFKIDVSSIIKQQFEEYLQSDEFRSTYIETFSMEYDQYKMAGEEWIRKIIPYSSCKSIPGDDYFLGICDGMEPEVPSCKLFKDTSSRSCSHTAYVDAYWMKIPTVDVLRYLWFKYPDFMFGKPTDPGYHGD